jgi:D-methionine transport system ATP-binding protein
MILGLPDDLTLQHQIIDYLKERNLEVEEVEEDA